MEDIFKRKLRSGDKESWAYLFYRYVEVLYDYGLCLSNDEIYIKNCIQDVFLLLYNRREEIDRIGCLQKYLLSSLRFRLLSLSDKSGKRSEDCSDIIID